MFSKKADHVKEEKKQKASTQWPKKTDYGLKERYSCVAGQLNLFTRTASLFRKKHESCSEEKLVTFHQLGYIFLILTLMNDHILNITALCICYH
jgi:hypothetical protein